MRASPAIIKKSARDASAEESNERHRSAPYDAGGERRRHDLRISRRKRPFHLQRAARLRHQARPGQARAVRRTHGRRVCEGQERTRGLPCDERTGDHEPGHRHSHGLRRFRTDDRTDRTGRRRVPRTGGVPGGRRVQSAHADHQAQLQGPGRQPSPPRHKRGVGHLPDGQEGAGSHRYARRPDGQGHGSGADPRGLRRQAADGGPRGHTRGRPMDPRVREAPDPRRRRRYRRLRGGHAAGQDDGCAGCQHPDGHGRRPLVLPDEHRTAGAPR